MKHPLLWSLLLVNGVCAITADSGSSSPLRSQPLPMQHNQMQQIERLEQPEPPSSPINKAQIPPTFPVLNSALARLAMPDPARADFQSASEKVIGLAYYNGDLALHPLPYYKTSDLTTICRDMSINTNGWTYRPTSTRVVQGHWEGMPTQILLSCGGKIAGSRRQETDWRLKPFQVRISCYDIKDRQPLIPIKSPAIGRYYALSPESSMPIDIDCPYSQAATADPPPEEIAQSQEPNEPLSLSNKIGVVKHVDIHSQYVSLPYQYGGDLDSLCEEIRGSNGVAGVQFRTDNQNRPYLLVDCKDYQPSVENSLFVQCYKVDSHISRSRSFVPFVLKDYQLGQPWVAQFYNNENVEYDCPGSRAYTDVIGLVDNSRFPQYYFRSQDLDTLCASLLHQQRNYFGHTADDLYEAVSSQGSSKLWQGFDLQCAQSIPTIGRPKQVSLLKFEVHCVSFGMDPRAGLGHLVVGSLSPLNIASYYQRKDFANKQHARRLGVFKDCAGGQAHQKVTPTSSAELYAAAHGSNSGLSSPFSSELNQYSPLLTSTSPASPPSRPGRLQRVNQGFKNGFGRVFNLGRANAAAIGIITRPSVEGTGGLTTTYRANEDLFTLCEKVYGGSPDSTKRVPLFNSDPNEPQFEIKLTCTVGNKMAIAYIECFARAGSVRVNPLPANSLGNYYQGRLDDCPGGLAEQGIAAVSARISPMSQISASQSAFGARSPAPPDIWEQAANADRVRTPTPEITEEPSVVVPNTPSSPIRQNAESQFASDARPPLRSPDIREQAANADRVTTHSPPPNQNVPVPPRKSWSWTRPSSWSGLRRNQPRPAQTL